MLYKLIYFERDKNNLAIYLNKYIPAVGHFNSWNLFDFNSFWQKILKFITIHQWKMRCLLEMEFSSHLWCKHGCKTETFETIFCITKSGVNLIEIHSKCVMQFHMTMASSLYAISWQNDNRLLTTMTRIVVNLSIFEMCTHTHAAHFFFSI